MELSSSDTVDDLIKKYENEQFTTMAMNVSELLKQRAKKNMEQIRQAIRESSDSFLKWNFLLSSTSNQKEREDALTNLKNCKVDFSELKRFAFDAKIDDTVLKDTVEHICSNNSFTPDQTQEINEELAKDPDNIPW